MSRQNEITKDDISKIVNMISESNVSAIIAPTGSGKSTKIIAEIFKMGGKDIRIFITEPTVPAVEGLYETSFTLKDEEGVPYYSREDVGKAAESNVNYTDRSKVIYCTAGHLRRKMLSYFTQGKVSEMDFCDIIILDEIHSGSLDNEVICALWNIASQKLAPRLVLMSATLTLKDLPIKVDNHYEIQTKVKFPVDIQYHSTGFPRATDPNIYLETARVVLEKHSYLPIQDQETWLVFCPGVSEIEKVYKEIIKANPENLLYKKAYSGLPAEERATVQDIPPKGWRKLVIATNIVEASITFRGQLTGIFDTMVEKYGATAPSGGARLITDFVSKSSAKQRAGRTGRTCPGFCYRMTTLFNFEELKDQKLPEILRIPLHNIMIELLSVGLDPAKIFRREETEFNTYTLLDKIEDCKFLLVELGMIEEGKISVTDLGKFAADFPIYVKNSAILWFWVHKFNPETRERYHPFPGIVAASIIDTFSSSSFFFYPKEVNKREHYLRYFSRFNSYSPLGVFINLFNEIFEMFKTLEPDGLALKEYCITNSLNNKQVRECLRKIKQICQGYSRLGPQFGIGSFDTDKFLSAFTDILFQCYYDKIYELSNKVYKNKSYGKVNFYELDVSGVLQIKEKPEKLIAISTFESQNQTGFRKVISLYQPVSKEFLFKKSENYTDDLGLKLKTEETVYGDPISDEQIQDEEI